MGISILIVNYNGAEVLGPCLASIFNNGSTGEVEVIVGDNASTDLSKSVALGWPVRWVQFPSNLGYGTALNRMAGMARYEYILILNNDIQIQSPRSCFEMVDFLESNPHYSCVAPKLVLVDGSLQESCRKFPSLWGELAELLGFVRMLPERFGGFLMTKWGHSGSRDIEQVAGAAMLLRRDTFLELGGFDETFPLYYEDVDLCLRLNRVGPIRFITNVQFTHVSKATASKYPLRSIVAIAAGRYKYFKIHKGLWAAECTRVISLARFISRAVALWIQARLSRESLARSQKEERARAYAAGIRYLLLDLYNFNPLEI